MTIVHGYCTPSDVQARVADVADRIDYVEQVIEGASRAIDQHCGRRFWADTSATARVYVARDAYCLDLYDISTTTGFELATDDNADGTYETVWSAANYQLGPSNGILDGVEGHPYTYVQAYGRSFPASGQRPLVRVTAAWGWAAVPAAVKSVCIGIAERALAVPAGVRSETVGSYQVQYQTAGDEVVTPFAFTDAERHLLAPFVRPGIA